MHQGSCLCGIVRYEVRGELGPGYFCHCGRCRKASGSAFGANAMIASGDFVVTAGEASFKFFQAESGLRRYFCGACGSPIISVRDTQPEVMRLRLGTLDTPITKPPASHIFAASKAEWDVINDAFPQYAERPPA